MAKMESFPHDAISLVPCPSKGILKLATGEFTIKCPYDLSHEVLCTRYYQHLEKCRRNYLKTFISKNERPLELSCKYNSEHQISAPEILYHEHGCPDKNNFLLEDIRLHQKKLDIILTGNQNSDLNKESEYEDDDDKDHPFDPVINAKIGLMRQDLTQLAWKLVKGDIMSDFKPYLYANGELLWADPAITKSGIHPFKLRPWKLSQTEDPIFHRRSYVIRNRKLYKKSPKDSKEEAKDKAEVEDDKVESWQAEDQPPFDWFQHQYDYRPSYSAPMRCPPGLGRREREEFSDWNKERLKTDFGVILEEDLEKTAEALSLKMNLKK